MPLYDYECLSCGNVFEMRQGFNDPPEAHCPDCNHESKRLFRPVGVIFKGSGFYVNEYGKGKEGSQPDSDNVSNSSTNTPSSSDTTASSSDD